MVKESNIHKNMQRKLESKKIHKKPKKEIKCTAKQVNLQ